MFKDLSPSTKKAIAFLYDSFVSVAAFQGAVLLRMGDNQEFSQQENIIYLSLTCLFQSATFYLIGFYKGIWRYSSTYDLLRIIKGASVGVIGSLLILFMYNRLVNLPRTIFIIDWLLLIVFLGGGRLGYRVIRDSVGFKPTNSTKKRVLIIGAGKAGERVFREVNGHPEMSIKVIGFLDDDTQLLKRDIHGCPVLGKIDEVENISKELSIDLIYVAIPSATGEQLKRIYELSRGLKTPIKVLPKIKDILDANIQLSQFRDIEVGDILGRKEIKLDEDSIANLVSGKRILISGAGGSIGSEIVRQVSLYSPEKIILLDNCELNLYRIEKELIRAAEKVDYEVYMVDVRDEVALRNAFDENPQVVFHAAAYKHVPLVESNPHSAIQTNILGTRIIAKVSNEKNVEKFVLISSDKAVNPTNIMGATKRISELICLAEQEKSKETKFITVRFGNVLGSSGSVIPLFKEQIKNGGPITITHPEIKRYFMSIPEASQLVLQSAAIGSGGEVFVLNMGEPIYILEMAKQMIALSGYNQEEIRIEFIGLRPGEKMFEELLLDSEETLKTKHPLVFRAQAVKLNPNFHNEVQSLIETNPSKEVKVFKRLIKEIVPEYTPSESSIFNTNSSNQLNSANSQLH
ncbi:MAG: polysaccharide biosynthesis protein [Bacteriovoracaceae bacterium]|nr:polysaccharide biosynthesis protein [Bacteriovoracaceae bacterium]